MSAISPTLCPYKGIVPYGEEDAPFFFGRERLIAQVELHDATALSAPLRGSRRIA